MRDDQIPNACESKTFWFGPKGQELCGRFYAPKMSVRPVGLVFCSPYGQEEVSSYRALRELAIMCADIGFPVLRFDYRGTGDSVGESNEFSLPQIWIEDVKSAVRQMCNNFGTKRVVIVGARLGAFLACHALRELGNVVSGLVLYAPVLSGSKYVREMLAFERLQRNDFSTGCFGSSDSFVQSGEKEANASAALKIDRVMGYEFSEALQSQLSGLGSLTALKPDVPFCYVAARDDISAGEHKLATAWSGSGVDLVYSPQSCYAQVMTDDAYKARSPKEVWQKILLWLDEHFPRALDLDLLPGAVSQFSIPSLNQDLEILWQNRRICEKVIEFDGMAGIVTLPIYESKKPLIIFTNVGANRMSGVHRIYTDLCRQLACLGYISMRYDRAGIGESRRDNTGNELVIYNGEGVDNVSAAISAALDKFRASSVALAGICAGGYFSLYAAAKDARVNYVSLINVPVFQWKDGDTLEIRRARAFKSNSFYRKKIFEKETFERLFKGNINIKGILKTMVSRILKRIKNKFAKFLKYFAIRQSSAGSLDAKLLELKRRNARVLVIYSEEDGGVDAMADEIGAKGGYFAKITRVSESQIW